MTIIDSDLLFWTTL